METLEGPIPAVVLAAGQGTRMRSARAKVLHPVCGRPMVLRAVRALLDAGCAPVVVVVGHQADAVRQALATLVDPRVEDALQHPPRGTGDALRCAAGAWSEAGGPCVVVPGDVPLLRADTVRDLVARHRQAGAAVSFLTFRPADPGAYGRVVRADDGSVEAIVELKDTTLPQRAIGEVNSGVYAIERRFAFGPEGALSRLAPANAAGELYLTDLVGLARSAGLRVAAHLHSDSDEVEGVNDRSQLARAESALWSRVARGWMDAGVCFHRPSSAMVDPEVSLSPDVEIGFAAALAGATRVGSGAVIGAQSRITDCDIGPGAEIGQGCVLDRVSIAAGARLLPYTVASGVHEKRPAASGPVDRVHIGAGARVGPFSHLRPGAVLGPEAHVGNFVEVKNVSMGARAKANHLAYLGDGEVGADANVGAGVIFCNYDGFQKHRTIIEEGAFIGSDCQLVAPVRVGRGAYVGSGTTVTRDVSDDALAVGRARQVELPGRAARLRERARARQGGTRPPAGSEPEGGSGG